MYLYYEEALIKTKLKGSLDQTIVTVKILCQIWRSLFPLLLHYLTWNFTTCIYRLGYPLLLVRKILESKTMGNKLHLMYDIACMFDRFLQVIIKISLDTLLANILYVVMLCWYFHLCTKCVKTFILIFLRIEFLMA